MASTASLTAGDHQPGRNGPSVGALAPRTVQEREDRALLDLLLLLQQRDYRFVTPTPATHRRVIARPGRGEARSITDVLGWSLPFMPDRLDREILDLLDAGGCLREDEGRMRATIRVSSLHDRLFVHSAYPTDTKDAVFFGPDSYRFADLIAAEAGTGPSRDEELIVDIGAGAGVGGIVAGLCRPGARITMVDVNPHALRFARINAEAAGIAADFVCGDTLGGVEGPVRLAVANPPYIIDEAGRSYRDGGDMHGARVALDMARMAVERLAPDGKLILYTGSPIIDGADPLAVALGALATETGRTFAYRELDPDVFGEELSRPAYQDVDRIALVAAIVGPRAG